MLDAITLPAACKRQVGVIEKDDTMKKLLLSTVAAVVFGTGAVFAQSIAEQVVTQLQAEGYQRIEVKNGPTQVKVEAIRNGMKLEVTYDAATGEVLKQEVRPVEAGEDTTPSVRIEDDSDDDIDDDDDRDDDDHGDDDDDHEDDDDHDEDDDDDHDDDDRDDDHDSGDDD